MLVRKARIEVVGYCAAAISVLAVCTSAWVQAKLENGGGPYTLECVSITSGGGTLRDPVTNADRGFAVVGQAVVGRMIGAEYTLHAGIVPCLFRFVRPDFNMDGLVNLDDFDLFESCATGPQVPYDPGDLPAGCSFAPDGQNRIAADLDRDGDVDQSDFAVFQRCYSGNQPASPACES